MMMKLLEHAFTKVMFRAVWMASIIHDEQIKDSRGMTEISEILQTSKYIMHIQETHQIGNSVCKQFSHRVCKLFQISVFARHKILVEILAFYELFQINLVSE